MAIQPNKRPAYRHPKRAPNFAPWPPKGYVGMEHLMAATGGRSAQTIYNWIQAGLLPPPQKIGPNSVAWPVDIATRALENLPNMVKKARGRPGRATRTARK